MLSQSIEYPLNHTVKPAEVVSQEPTPSIDQSAEKESESKTRLELLRSFYAESDCV